MMKKIFHLGTCSTCKRIISELELAKKDFDFQDIKTEAIQEEQLEKMKEMSGTYESLFSRRAQKYKALDLKSKNLGENDFKKLILEEYTFLKRPVIIIGDQIFIGNSKKVVEAASKAI